VPRRFARSQLLLAQALLAILVLYPCNFGGLMPKFDFALTTRDGQKVESVQIYGKDLPDAERKLRQMYHHCQVTQCRTVSHERELSQSADIEDVLSLIVKQD